MDLLDVKILQLLEENGRIPVKEISQKVNLTAPAVSERIKRLENTGVIKGYRAKVSYSRLGFTIRALINISMDVSNYDAFYVLAKKEPAIIECYHVTGSYCMSVKVAVKNVKELESLLNKIQKFGDTNSQIILSSPFEGKCYSKNI